MKEIFTISASSNIAKGKATSESIKGIGNLKEEGLAKDFFSIMSSQIKEGIALKEKNTSNLTDNALLSSNEEQALVTSEKKSLGEHLLKDILEIVSILKNSSDKKPSFPNYSDKLEKLLNKQSVLNDFKEVKNISDLFKLSKKYDLGLENISAKKIDIETLKSEFPKLDKSFFKLPEMKEETKHAPQLHTNSKEIKKTEHSEAVLKSMEKVEQKPQKELSLFEKIMQPKKEEISNTENKKSASAEGNIQTKDVKEKVETPTLAETSKKTLKETSENIQKITPIVEEKKVEKKTSKEENEKLIIPKDSESQEKPVNMHTTRTEDLKIQQNTDKKGLIETILQGLKNEKQTQNQKVMAQNEEIRTMDKGLTQENSNEIKNEPSLRATDLKNPLRSEHLQNRPTTPTNQSLNSFANDLRERIENYKPPLMKVQMALNPKALGEVDVTIINRGNNLQVNITSNATTMSLFTQNQAEFKNSLVNMGFTNLEMNFSDQREQKNHENRQGHHSGMGLEEELSEEELNEQTQSVEITLPQYI